MYRTSSGVRTLKGAEAAFFKAGLAYTAYVVDELDAETGVDAFDRWTIPQRLWLLAKVGESLLVESAAETPLTACYEAAVAAVFAVAFEDLGCEVDDMASLPWCDLLHAAILELETPSLASEGLWPTREKCTDHDWHIAIQVVTDRILWDRDFEDGDIYSHNPFEHNAQFMELMDIHPDYFIDAPPKLSDEMVPGLLSRIEELTGKLV